VIVGLRAVWIVGLRAVVIVGLRAIWIVGLRAVVSCRLETSPCRGGAAEIFNFESNTSLLCSLRRRSFSAVAVSATGVGMLNL
jgi:hypothetical protein